MLGTTVVVARGKVVMTWVAKARGQREGAKVTMGREVAARVVMQAKGMMGMEAKASTTKGVEVAKVEVVAGGGKGAEAQASPPSQGVQLSNTRK